MANSKIKWIFTLAGKNNITEESLYAYIKEKHNAESMKSLTDKQLNDVMLFVSDSRMIKTEKQIYLACKIAEELGIGDDGLNSLAKRLGAPSFRDLNEKGAAGMIAILTKMRASKAVVTISPGINLVVSNGEKSLYVNTGDTGWVYTDNGKTMRITENMYCGCDIGKIADKKISAKASLSDADTRIATLVMKEGDEEGKIMWLSRLKNRKMEAYYLGGRIISVAIRCKP